MTRPGEEPAAATAAPPGEEPDAAGASQQVEDAAAATGLSERLAGLTADLGDAARRLRAGDLDADAAAALIEDCGRLAGAASHELERLARAAEADEAPPGPGQLELADRP